MKQPITTLRQNDMNALASMRTQAQNGDIEYWQIYSHISQLLVNDYSVAPDNSTILWLNGATEANAGRGMYSAMIRAYSNSQAELRYGSTFDEKMMQQASNKVCENLLRDLIDGVDGEWMGGGVPNLTRIGLADATAVGEVLFNRDPDDTAAPPQGNAGGGKNSAWAGSLLFSPLGGDETYRLLSRGEIDKAIDSINDWRDVLYAKISFDKAFWAGAKEFGKNLALSEIDPTGNSATQLQTDIKILGQTNIAFFKTGGLGEAFYNTWFGTSKPELLEAFKLISKIGENKFLDMLISAEQGKAVETATNDDTFEANARGFFEEYLALDTQSLYDLSANEIISRVKQNNEVGENTRTALKVLSFVSVDVSDTVASNNELYSKDNPDGMTDNYIKDRANMLIDKVKWNTSTGLAQVTDYYHDEATNESIGRERQGHGNQIINKQYIFGSKGNDEGLEGGEKDDHIYGGAGIDTLIGGKGDDRLEGGTGFDTYVIEGSDTIFDSDGQGEIKSGNTIIDADRKLLENVYISTDGKFYIRKIIEKDETNTLKIWKRGEDDDGKYTTVKNWKNGDLGIDISDAPLIEPDGNEIDYAGATHLIAENEPANYQNDKKPDQENYYHSSTHLSSDKVNAVINAGDSDDIIDFTDQDVRVKVNGGDGSDIIVTGNKDDTIWVDEAHGWEIPKPYSIHNVPPESAHKINGLPHDSTGKIYGNWSNTVISGAGNDHIYGYYGQDTIVGEEGDDRMFGAGNIDQISGGSGNDLIHGDGIVEKQMLPKYWQDLYFLNNLTDDTYGAYVKAYREANKALDMDLIKDHTISDESPFFDGTAHGQGFVISKIANSTFYDTNLAYHDNDILSGDAGDDILIGEGGSDTLYGGSDNDLLLGDNISILYNSIQSDNFSFKLSTLKKADKDELTELKLQWQAEYSGEDNLFGGEGDDRIYGGSKTDYIEGNEGNDTIYADSDLNTYYQEENVWNHKFTTPLTGNLTTDFLYTYQNIEDLTGSKSNPFTIAGDDVVLGGTGNDIIYGEGGKDYIKGGADNDTLHGDRRYNSAESTNKNALTHGEDALFGGNGNDTIYGGGKGDYIEGGDGNDVIEGDYTERDMAAEFHGDDIILGGSGDDTVYGLGGDDNISGDEGDDTLVGDASSIDLAGQHHGKDLIKGGLGKDTIHGAGNNDDLYGDEGNDYIRGDADASDLEGQYHGDDYIEGGKGDDTVHGDGGIDTIYGGDGNDSLSGDHQDLDGENHADDYIDAGNGNDHVWGDGGNDIILGGSGDDYLEGDVTLIDKAFHGDDTIYGGDGKDTVFGDAGNDTLYGDAGKDHLQGGEGNDDLYGGTDNDSLHGEKGNDKLFGESGDDGLSGGMGDDELSGGAGNDTLKGEVGTDTLHGDEGDDILKGGAGTDTLHGDEGNDWLDGGDGTDELHGGAGNDKLNAGEGDDSLYAGAGQDRLVGGKGSDTYYFESGDGDNVIIEDLSDLRASNDENYVQFQFNEGTVTSIKNINDTDLRIEFGDSDSLTVKNYYMANNTSNHAQHCGCAGCMQAMTANRSSNDNSDNVSAEDPYTNNLEIAEFRFLDGTIWTSDEIMAMAPPPDEPYKEPEPTVDSNGNELPYFIDALITRYDIAVKGKTHISYGFLANPDNELRGFQTYTQEQKQAVKLALEQYSKLLNVTFVEETGSSPDFQFYLDDLSSSGLGAYAGFASAQTGEVHINSSKYGKEGQLNQGEYGFEVLLHEIGHAMGLKHPFEAPLLPSSQNNQDNTVMSYTSNDNNDIELKSYDIAALQYLYGINPDIEKVDNEYTFDNKFIIDADGIDTLSSSNQTENVHIDLNQGGWSYVGEKNDNILADNQSFINYGTHIENAIGGSGNDTLVSNDLNNILTGGTGQDTYVFKQGDGVDTIIDQDSDSTIVLEDINIKNLYQYNNVLYYSDDDGLVVNIDHIANWQINGEIYTPDGFKALVADAGSDLINVSEDTTLINDQVGAILTGSDNLNLTGNNEKNILIGNEGNNILDGKAGTDRLIGKAGDDIYIVDNVNDKVIEEENEGTDTIQSSVDYELAENPNVENLTLTGTAINAKGNSLNNTIHGNELDNILSSGEGNNALYGESGNDTLISKNGDNILDGGEGNDAVHYSDAQNAVNVDLSNLETQDTGNGLDKLIDIENLFGSKYDDNLTGNEQNNSLDGGDGNDRLNGGIGNDTLTGGTGQDTYVLKKGDGNDTIIDQDTNSIIILEDVNFDKLYRYNDVLYYSDDDKVAVDIDHIASWQINGETYTSTEFKDAVNNSIPDSIVVSDDTVLTESQTNAVLTGSDNLSLTGNNKNNILIGNEGHNLLDGGAGADTLIGKAGDDVYIVDNVNDKVTERENEGTDTIQSSIDYDLAKSSNVENLTLTGTAVNATGNSLNNTIHGNELDNTLNGGGGSNTLYGEAGNDTLINQGVFSYLYGGAGNDTYILTDTIDEQKIIEQADKYEGRNKIWRALDSIDELSMNKYSEIDDKAGIDTVISSASHRLSHFIDNLILKDTAIYGIGNNGSNQLQGNNNDNVLIGERGTDTFIGGKGNDFFASKSGDDIVILSKGDGNDIYRPDYANEIMKNLSSASVHFLDVNKSECSFSILGNDLLISYGNDDSLTIQGFTYGKQLDEVVKYADGTSDSYSSIANTLTQEYIGTDGIDRLVYFGHIPNIYMDGLDGNDTLVIKGVYSGSGEAHGGEGNDTFNPEFSQNITLYGGKGNDIYNLNHEDNWSYGTSLRNIKINDSEGESTIRLPASEHYSHSHMEVRTYTENQSYDEGSDTYHMVYTTSGGRSGDFFYDVTTKTLRCDYQMTIGDDMYNDPDQYRYNMYHMGVGANHPIYADATYFSIENLGLNSLDNYTIKIDGAEYVQRGTAGSSTYSIEDGTVGLRDYIGQGKITTKYTNADEEIHLLGIHKHGVDSIFAEGGDDTIYLYGDIAKFKSFGRETSEYHGGEGNDIFYGKRTVHGDVYGEKGNDIITTTGLFRNDVFGGEGNDTITMEASDDSAYAETEWQSIALHGGTGNDAITSKYGKVYGEDGNDTLVSLGAITMNGGKGDDTIIGGNGDDTVMYKQGDGKDILKLTDNITANDTLIIEGYSYSEAEFSKQDDDLIIRFDADNSILIEKYFATSNDSDIDHKLDTLIFKKDNQESSFNQQQIDLMLHNLNPDDSYGEVGTLGDDNIFGTENDDTIDAKGGDDTIDAKGGNDFIDGGTGADTMIGGAGNDYYVVDKYDTLIENQDGSKFIVHGDLVAEGTLWNRFVQGDSGGIDTVEQWDDHRFYKQDEQGNWIDTGSSHYLQKNIENLILKGEAKTAFGNDLNNIITLNEQNNFANALAGDDTIIYTKGGGQDSLKFTDSLTVVDTLVIEGYGIQQAKFQNYQDSLYISFGNSNDSIWISEYFVTSENSTSDNKVDKIIFRNGDDEYILIGAEIDDAIGKSFDDGSNDNGNDNPDDLSGNNAIRDTLGNDTLEGGAGNDTYIYTGGQDILIDTKGVDKLVFANGITFNQVSSGLIKSADGHDLILQVDGNADNQITLPNYFTDYNSIIETVAFESGSAFTYEQVFSMFEVAIPKPSNEDVIIISGDDLIGTDANETLQGTDESDRLQGLSGNDILKGQAGDDILVAGEGNDTLIGGEGNDLYYIEEGFGNDTIINTGGGIDNIYFDGLGFDDVAQGLTRSGDDLILKTGNSSDSLTLQDFFIGGENAELNIAFELSSQNISAEMLMGGASISNTHTQAEYNSSLGTMLSMMDQFNASTNSATDII